MYNRYIPQADGTYLRSRMPEPERKQEQPAEPEAPNEKAENMQTPKQSAVTGIQPKGKQPYPRPTFHQNRPEPKPVSVSDFLKNILPRNFDTEDLIVVLLLLLMSEKNGSGSNTALMTLGIYLFM